MKDGMHAGDIVKVCLPGESPWAECVATYDDGTWEGRIDNDVGPSSLHNFKYNQIVRFRLWQQQDLQAWVPADLTHGAA